MQRADFKTLGSKLYVNKFKLFMLKSPIFKGYCKRWEVNKSIKVTSN